MVALSTTLLITKLVFIYIPHNVMIPGTKLIT